uniref:Uncharacterized protein n=1 Tax=Moumouvirus sp. 'Monve' TaxID=1128131 RepID=H2ECT3_9VIRU|nr:hypothetical protein mv_L1 [Moumouvirus Monve]
MLYLLCLTKLCNADNSNKFWEYLLRLSDFVNDQFTKFITCSDIYIINIANCLIVYLITFIIVYILVLFV